jgi:hypothetical protein
MRYYQVKVVESIDAQGAQDVANQWLVANGQYLYAKPKFCYRTCQDASRDIKYSIAIFYEVEQQDVKNIS